MAKGTDCKPVNVSSILTLLFTKDLTMNKLQEEKSLLHLVGMIIGTVLIGFLFGVGYNLSLMLFN